MTEVSTDDVKKSTYFANRNVNEELYSDYRLPRYLSPYFSENDKQLNILDIGCGLGQLLSNLKKKRIQKS